MKVYRVSLWADDSHVGHEFFSSKKAAEQCVRENGHENDSIEPIEFKPTLGGIIKILNYVGGHPDNG